MGRKRWPVGLVAEVVAVYGRTCWLCHETVPDGETVSLDHVQPDVFGGSDALDNLRPAHAYCNLQRAEWDVGSYYAWALATGRPSLVPEALRALLLPGAAELAERARVYYARLPERPANLAPLGGSWALAPTSRGPENP